ncbi:MAG TPA: YciI family protein [Dehalococcoidia bacterium]|nr:YciI family protein [Dehalococcoidia bacterium]
MRVMVIVKGDERSEAGVMPTEQELAEMGTFNEELVNAGIMLAGEGLHPTSKGVKVKFDGDARTVVDGPFTETKEVLGGFWIWQVGSMQEATEWAKKIPFRKGEVEIRPVFETEEFAESDPTGEQRRREHELRARIEAQQAGG